MTNIVDNNVFEDIPLIEEGDEVKGGVDGAANKQAIALANRTAFLKQQQEQNKQQVDNLKATDVGAAEATHTHVVADVVDYVVETKKLIDQSFEPGQGVAFGQNPLSGKTSINFAGTTEAGSPFIVANVENAVANQQLTFTFKEQSEFNLQAYALKSITRATNKLVTLYNFTASDLAGFDKTVDINFDNGAKLFLNAVYPLQANGDLFYSPAITLNGDKSGFQNGVAGNVPPVMTSNTAPSGYVASSSTSWDETLYPAYKAFNGDSTTNNEVCWNSGRNTIPTAAAPQWLQIKLPMKTTIEGYSIVNRGSFPVSQQSNPKSWSLLGSDDGTTWTTVHTVTGDTNNTPLARRDFTLPTAASFTYYRLNITETNIGGSGLTYTSVKSFILKGAKNKFLLQANNKNYTAANGVLTEVAGTLSAALINTNGFEASGDIPFANLPANSATIVSSSSGSVSFLNTPKPQIFLNKNLASMTNYAKVRSGTVNATVTGGGKVTMAVTRNGVDYFVYKNSAWVNIGALANDSSHATTLLAQGMTPVEFNALTDTAWDSFFANKKPDYLAFAFGFSATAPATDVALVSSLALTIDETTQWKLQTPAEVEIYWLPDSVTFKTINPGNYKLGYQVPGEQ